MSSAAIATKPKSEMTDQELAALEEAEFQTGPLSLLTQVPEDHCKKEANNVLERKEPQSYFNHVQVQII